MSSALTSTRKWTSFLIGDNPVKEGILEHMNLLSPPSEMVRSASSTYCEEVELAMSVPETGIDKGVGRANAVYSALALMILFSIKSRNCVWLRNRSLSKDVYHMAFTGVDYCDTSNALRGIHYAVNQAKQKDPFFSSELPRPYDNSNVSERETAIAVGATCAAMYGDIVQDVFTTVTG